ncbi:MAG: DUF2809 domain-containing protein [Candidatus Pacebacteria bacterium]|nr:DUF2809 domain-containing protein [Candidatus Paceibacterota bacterium]
MIIKINKSQVYYFSLFLLFFVLEIVFVYIKTNEFIRSYVSDILAVMYVYFFFRCIRISVFMSFIVTAFIAVCIETIQYLAIFETQDNFLSKMIIGGTFDSYDFVAYTVGLLCVLTIEYLTNKKALL